MNDTTKHILASKTFWTSVLVAATPLFSAAVPPVGAFLAANAEWVCSGLAAVFLGLRMVTDSKVEVRK